jgi:uncharacterized protein YodC (DUF2158 family)
MVSDFAVAHCGQVMTDSRHVGKRMLQTDLKNLYQQIIEEMPMSFSAGDVVKLKSGGPSMAIQRIYSEENIEYASCSWFDGNTKMSDTFATASLEPAQPRPKKTLRGVPSKTKRR